MEPLAITPFAALGHSVFSLVAESGPFAKGIVLIVFLLSVISFAVIFDRTRLFLRLRKGGRRLQEELATKGLGISMATVQRNLPSIEGALLLETKRFLEGKKGDGPVDVSNPAVHTQLKDLLDGRAASEISEMEKYLIFLATTASVSPFLGLLGTVWGIMSSFLSMGVEGSASIEVVGPGIAEALTTTIVGLGAAISALVGYNLLIRHVRRQESLVELFVSRILALTAISKKENPTSYPKREVSYAKKPL